jgi:hypothetical protein
MTTSQIYNKQQAASSIYCYIQPVVVIVVLEEDSYHINDTHNDSFGSTRRSRVVVQSIREQRPPPAPQPSAITSFTSILKSSDSYYIITII